VRWKWRSWRWRKTSHDTPNCHQTSSFAVVQAQNHGFKQFGGIYTLKTTVWMPSTISTTVIFRQTKPTNCETTNKLPNYCLHWEREEPTWETERSLPERQRGAYLREREKERSLPKRKRGRAYLRDREKSLAETKKKGKRGAYLRKRKREKEKSLPTWEREKERS